jgi:Ribonuclease HepT-like
MSEGRDHDCGRHIEFLAGAISLATTQQEAPAATRELFASVGRALEGEAGVLGAELAGRLERMARFRNLLVHQYAEVDDPRVFEFLRKDVGDVDRFIAAVLAAFPALGE